MKFAAATLALAATAAAWKQTTPGPGVNPHLSEVLEDMPEGLVKLLNLVPQDFMNALIGGQAWLPLTPQEFLDIATDIPKESLSAFSTDYINFISTVSSLLPTPSDQKTANDEDTEAASPTGSEEGDLPSADGDESSGDEKSGMSGDEKSGMSSDDDEEKSDDVDSEDSETSGASAIARPIAAIAMIAAAASFF
ncbi:hypothetical protein GGF43_006443 [Coemansia sp. RSA 2618]|nr:hypothetical protein GGF43_006443 [Coemansia sp. RSA 2618]